MNHNRPSPEGISRTCSFCDKLNHTTDKCFHNPSNNRPKSPFSPKNFIPIQNHVGSEPNYSNSMEFSNRCHLPESSLTNSEGQNHVKEDSDAFNGHIRCSAVTKTVGKANFSSEDSFICESFKPEIDSKINIGELYFVDTIVEGKKEEVMLVSGSQINIISWPTYKLM